MELRPGGPQGGAQAERSTGEEHGLAATRWRGSTREEPRGSAVEREHGGEGARGEEHGPAAANPGAAATVLCAHRNVWGEWRVG